MSGDDQKLNPQVRTVEVGVRNLRKINIYPMSMADQSKFMDLFQEALNTFLQYVPEGNLSESDLLPLFTGLSKLVGQNSKEFIKIVTDEKEVDPERFFDEVTNVQMSQIIKYIIEDNFEEPSKNVMSLFQTVKNLFRWGRPSPTFLNDTPNSGSTISTD